MIITILLIAALVLVIAGWILLTEEFGSLGVVSWLLALACVATALTLFIRS